MSEPHNADIALEHSYDGIQEYDNRLPNWWLWSLYLAVIFSIAYWIFYQSMAIGSTQDQNWRAEMAAQAAWELEKMGDAVTDESLLLMSQIPETVDAGRAHWAQCVQCHLEDGASATNGIGPNLTDEFWLHGGRPTQIHKTVMFGVPEKGMQAWGETMGPKKVREVVAFVLSEIKGKNRPGKAPQGEKEQPATESGAGAGEGSNG